MVVVLGILQVGSIVDGERVVSAHLILNAFDAGVFNELAASWSDLEGPVRKSDRCENVLRKPEILERLKVIMRVLFLHHLLQLLIRPPLRIVRQIAELHWAALGLRCID